MCSLIWFFAIPYGYNQCLNDLWYSRKNTIPRENEKRIPNNETCTDVHMLPIFWYYKNKKASVMLTTSQDFFLYYRIPDAFIHYYRFTLSVGDSRVNVWYPNRIRLLSMCNKSNDLSASTHITQDLLLVQNKITYIILRI